MKTKLQINSIFGKLLFEYECEDNTIAKTVQEAIKSSANLRFANLSSANLRFADLSSANLRFADLSSANLSSANLRFAKNIPNAWVFQSSRDILFILQSMKNEVPFLKERLIAGKVNGQVYSGDCACLIGTIGKANGSDEAGVCNHIPFYELGTHNLGEAYFLNIKEGDTPESSIFVKHAVALCDMVISGVYTTNNPWLEPETPKIEEKTVDEEVETAIKLLTDKGIIKEGKIIVSLPTL